MTVTHRGMTLHNVGIANRADIHYLQKDYVAVE